MFDFSDYSVKSKYYNYSNALVVGKMKYEMGSVALKKFWDESQKCTKF